MRLELKRFTPREREFDTLGLLFINGDFACLTLEDRYREVKVPRVTRIPEGTYNLTLRTIGSHHIRYYTKYGDWHKGMIELQHVPGYTDILMHIGNAAENTDGCILVGSGIASYDPSKPATILSSTVAYERIYPVIRDAILREPTYIIITEEVVWNMSKK
jgi:hypothetical protein